MKHSLRELQGVVVCESGAVPKRDASERLWCVHIEGLDDFIAASSQDAALQEALAINAYIDRLDNRERVSVVRAAAVEWPFTPASHALSLEVDWDDLQHMPHRRPSANPPESALAAIARRVKELIRMVGNI